MSQPIPLAAQIACVARELTMRYRVYPNMVLRGKITQAEMDHELACMHAVQATLQRLDAEPMLFPVNSEA